MSALFLSPHPDDVELFAGGTVAALAGQMEVWIADLTRGEMSSNGTVEQREREAAAAAAALGVESARLQLGLADAGLDERHPGQLRAIADLLAELDPDLVFAPWIEDRHPDHVAAGRLARRAVDLVTRQGGRGARVLSYPCHTGVETTIAVDVTATIDRWEEAVRCYPSQFLAAGTVATPINRPGFIEHHRARRARWGLAAGFDFAEGFVHDGPWPVSVTRLSEVLR